MQFSLLELRPDLIHITLDLVGVINDVVPCGPNVFGPHLCQSLTCGHEHVLHQDLEYVPSLLDELVMKRLFGWHSKTQRNSVKKSTGQEISDGNGRESNTILKVGDEIADLIR